MSIWFEVMPWWAPWALLAGGAFVVGWLAGFWCGGRDRESELRFVRMRLSESDAQVRQMLVDTERRMRRMVEGGYNDAA